MATNSSTPSRRTTWAVCGLLVLAVAAIYGQTARHGFVNFDDDEYVYANPHVLAGLNGRGIAWAFTNREVSAQWQPIALLSLMADVQLSGVTTVAKDVKVRGDDFADRLQGDDATPRRPGTVTAKSAADLPPSFQRIARRMHLVNAALHAVNAVLVFLLLRALTHATWRSALVAAVFAVHPLHVESVAWITERKDVLCGLFGLLSLAAYVGYARRPSVLRYLAVAAALALGLMCKPMLVTWPLVFLLLDYWPLGRNKGTGYPAAQRLSLLILEKVPFFLLVAASAVVAFLAQKSGGGVVSLQTTPIPARIARAAVIYVTYLGRTLWPANLAVLYPVALLQSYWPALASLLVLTVITAAVLWGAYRGRRWLATGWFWYLLTLLPTIGLVQVGTQVRADRFMYLPQIGLCLAAVWGLAAFFRRRPTPTRSVSEERPTPTRSVSEEIDPIVSWRVVVLAALVFAGWTACAWRLTASWQSGETLWRRALECTSQNSIAEYNLGVALRDNGKHSEAVDHFRRAVRFDSSFMEARNNLCVALNQCQRYDEAVAEYHKVLEIKPKLASAHYNLGNVLVRRGQPDAGIAEYRRALELEPDHGKLHHNLAVALNGLGEHDAALAEYRKALAMEPFEAVYHDHLAVALENGGQFREALDEYRTALDLAAAQDDQDLVAGIRQRMERCAGKAQLDPK